jgi:hypothetical protein
MKFMPAILFLFFVQLSTSAHAEHFNCNLNLELIEGTSSSELKQLIFDVEINQDHQTVNSGVMVTVSCFGTSTDAFTSSTGKFRKMNLGDLTIGTFKETKMTIGSNQYQMNLKFAQLTKSPDESKTIDFIASGKILSINNEYFIHQNIKGECHLTKERAFSMNFLTMPDERCKDQKEI